MINDFLNDIYRIMISNFNFQEVRIRQLLRWIVYMNFMKYDNNSLYPTMINSTYMYYHTSNDIVRVICCIMRFWWNWKCKALKDCLSLVCIPDFYQSFFPLLSSRFLMVIHLLIRYQLIDIIISNIGNLISIIYCDKLHPAVS